MVNMVGDTLDRDTGEPQVVIDILELSIILLCHDDRWGTFTVHKEIMVKWGHNITFTS